MVRRSLLSNLLKPAQEMPDQTKVPHLLQMMGLKSEDVISYPFLNCSDQPFLPRLIGGGKDGTVIGTTVPKQCGTVRNGGTVAIFMLKNDPNCSELFRGSNVLDKQLFRVKGFWSERFIFHPTLSHQMPRSFSDVHKDIFAHLCDDLHIRHQPKNLGCVSVRHYPLECQ